MKPTRKIGGARLIRERENLETIVRLFCRCQHHGESLCPECQQLLDNSKAHLDSCHLGEDKPICDNCSFRCFLPGYREKLTFAISATRTRMLWQYPHIALRHWFDSFHHVSSGALRRNYGSWGSE